MFPSPHSGILFLLKTCLKMKQSVLRKCFRPLIRGFFFYDRCGAVDSRELSRRFRPLIRGFFFYYQGGMKVVTLEKGVVSVPSFGDSFFICAYSERMIQVSEKVSVPSFGDSFFIRRYTLGHLRRDSVSVPSFGDSFFMSMGCMQEYAAACVFPSPHSGILFLLYATYGD